MWDWLPVEALTGRTEDLIYALAEEDEDDRQPAVVNSWLRTLAGIRRGDTNVF